MTFILTEESGSTVIPFQVTGEDGRSEDANMSGPLNSTSETERQSQSTEEAAPDGNLSGVVRSSLDLVCPPPTGGEGATFLLSQQEEEQQGRRRQQSVSEDLPGEGGAVGEGEEGMVCGEGRREEEGGVDEPPEMRVGGDGSHERTGGEGGSDREGGEGEMEGGEGDREGEREGGEDEGEKKTGGKATQKGKRMRRPRKVSAH